MGVGLYTFCFLPTSSTIPSRSKSNHNSFLFNSFTKSLQTYLPKPANFSMVQASKCSGVEEVKTHQGNSTSVIFDPHKIDPQLLQKMEYDALVWSSLHGLHVGDRNSQRSGKVPGVGMVHAPFSLLPMPFPESHWKQACQIAPIFNELVDRVSLDGKFLQDSLSKTKKVDAFTYRLLEIHSKMLDAKKIEEIRLGLHRSDYMLDEQTKLLLQIELNTISTSSFALGCLVSELHRSLLHQYRQYLALNPERIPQNSAVTQFAEALSKAWSEYNNPRAVIMVVVQTEERNMYDQHWLCTTLKERYQVTSIKKTLAEIDALGELLPDGTLVVNGEVVAVVYFRAGYAPRDYPSEAEWRARLLMEQSSAIKCPSIAYHLVGTKKIQQELAKPNVLERFLENKDDIVNIRKCFAGLWSLEDSNIVKDAIEKPGLYVMKPQREGGGNNIYGDDVRETLLRIGKEGSGESAAYILMQRIFPTLYPAILVRQGISQKDNVVSEIGINAAYLRTKTKVIINEECGYLMRTKASSVNEGGVIAGTGCLDSIYLV